MKNFRFCGDLAVLLTAWVACGPAAMCQQISVQGRISDDGGRWLPFVNVYFQGTTRGTATNDDGFYKMEAAPGRYTLVFKHIGYKTSFLEVTLAGKPVTLNIVMRPESYNLGEVVVIAGEDPAYAIIRNAIAKRKFYRDQVEAFSCNVYIKGLQRLLKWPEKILGQEIRIEQFLDTNTHIIYLSESVSKYSFHEPDRIYEEMISSKVSGNNRAFSWNRASEMQFNFYENLIETDINPRGVVSPVASNALFYYRYRLEGTYIDQGVLVNKIAVIPRRKNDPVFRGTIYIQDGAWRIHASDVFLTRESGLILVDTLAVHQVFIPVGDESVWMPASSRFDFHFDVLGFEGNGSYMGVYSDYNLSPEPVRKSRGEVMKVYEDANQKDTAYWNARRPVPLTHEETANYIHRDSTQAVRESKAWLDSIDRKNNKINPGKILLFGYTYSNQYRKREFSASALTQNVQFSTVEGLNFSVNAGFVRKFENEKRNRISVTAMVKYGLANESFQATGKLEYPYNQLNHSMVSLEGGRRSVQYNEDEPISSVVNTAYTLMSERNYAKYLSKTFVKAGFRRELLNGLILETAVTWAQRDPLVNHTDYTFSDKENRIFSSNNPLSPADDTPAFQRNQAFTYSAGLLIRFNQRYISRPYRKVILGTLFPALRLRYHGAADVLGADVRMNLVEASLADDYNLGLAGSFSLEAWYGRFLSGQKLFFNDYKHFMGNRTVFSRFGLRKYYMLDYYAYSTNREYVEVHAEHNFKGFLFNKIPLLRKLRLDEIAGFHFLHVPGLPGHYELSAGASKLNLIRVEVAMAFSDGRFTQTALRIAVVGVQ